MTKEKVGILLIHGYSSTPNNFRELIPQIKALGLPYRSPTLRGHGTETPDSLRGVHWKEWITDGEQALSELLIEAQKVIIIGHSMGGWISLHLSIDYPQKVDSIVIAGSSTKAVSPISPGKPLYFLVPIIIKLVNKLYFPPVYTDKKMAAMEPSYPWIPAVSIIQLFNIMKATHERLDEVTKPILILHSKADTTNSPEGAKELYKKIKTPIDQKRLIWFEKTNHVMFLDCEREKVNRIIQEYIKERLELINRPTSA